MNALITLFLLGAVFQVVSAVTCSDSISTQTIFMTLTAANDSAVTTTSLVAMGSPFNGTSSVFTLTGSLTNPFLNSTVTSTTHITSTVAVAGSTSTETEDDTSMATTQPVITPIPSVIPMTHLTTDASVSSDGFVPSDGAFSVTATTAVTVTNAIPEITVTDIPVPEPTSIAVFTSVTLTSFLTSTSTVVVTPSHTPVPVTSSLVFHNSTITSSAVPTGYNDTNITVTDVLPLFTVTVVPLPVEINLTTTIVQVTVYATNITWSGTAYVVPSSTLNSTSTLLVIATAYTDTTIDVNASALVTASAKPSTTAPATVTPSVTVNATSAYNISLVAPYLASHTVTYLGSAGHLHAPLPLLLLSNLFNAVAKAVEFCMPLQTTTSIINELTTVPSTVAIIASDTASITSSSVPTHAVPVPSPIHTVESICPSTLWIWILSILGMNNKNTHCHLPPLPFKIGNTNNNIDQTSSYPNVSKGDFVQSALHPINHHTHTDSDSDSVFHKHNARTLSAISTQYSNGTNNTTPIAVSYISVFETSTSTPLSETYTVWTATQTYNLNGINTTHTYSGTKTTGAPAIVVSHTSPPVVVHNISSVHTTTVVAGAEGVKEGNGLAGSVGALVVFAAVVVLAL